MGIVKHIPNTITCLNLFSGCVASIMAVEGQFFLAALFVLLAAVFDFLDVHAFGYHWPAFNIADSFICIGAFLIILDGLCAKNCGKVKNFHEGIEK